MPRTIPKLRGSANRKLGQGLTRIDPTRTLALRKQFSLELRRRPRPRCLLRQLLKQRQAELTVRLRRDNSWGERRHFFLRIPRIFFIHAAELYFFDPAAFLERRFRGAAVARLFFRRARALRIPPR